METHESPCVSEPSMVDERYRIDVSVRSRFLPDESAPAEDRFVFAYTVTITNRGSCSARLTRRRWEITDAFGHEQHVEGAGVVGEQPYLAPGQAFRYTSAAMINTPVGTMQGGYAMVADDGHSFEADIPLFGLAMPTALH